MKRRITAMHIIFYLSIFYFQPSITCPKITIETLKKNFLKKNFTIPFYRWGSAATVYFLPLGSQKFLVLTLSTSEGWKAESTLEPASGFEHGTPGLGIQRLKVWNISKVNNKDTRTKPLASFWCLCC